MGDLTFNYERLVQKFLDAIVSDSPKRQKRSIYNSNQTESYEVDLGVEGLVLTDFISRDGAFEKVYCSLKGVHGEPRFSLPLDVIYEVQTLYDYGELLFLFLLLSFFRTMA